MSQQAAQSRPAAPSAALQRPVEQLYGVGPHAAARLKRLNIHTAQDLLLHLPLRYEDRTRITPIGALRPGAPAVVQGEVLLADVTAGRRPTLAARIGDGTGQLTLRFFHFTPRQRAGLARGVTLRCYGEVRAGPAGLEMAHPEYRVAGDTRTPPECTLTPVYPVTEGLRQATLRGLIERALDTLRAAGPSAMEELLPHDFLQRREWPELAAALCHLHQPTAATPPPDLFAAAPPPALQRLAFEELLAHHLALREARRHVGRYRAPAIEAGDESLDRVLQNLPFRLTDAQLRVIAEIRADLARDTPMQRLVQGDVGSGKTVVAAAVTACVVETGRQAAIMAPTELLAEQHYQNFARWLNPLGVDVVWLAGRLKGAPRREALDRLGSGRSAVAVGTHALFQAGVAFADLALTVIDEQHRFGVDQRLALLEKGRRGDSYPHQLIMTATPIPRTLAMTAYADLDSSVIDQLPAGRLPVATVAVPEQRRAEVVARIRDACGAGRQAYWVCPLIEESESLDCQSAVDTSRYLAAALPGITVGLVHGRMKAAQKEGVMRAFKTGEIQLLVATTVIEVGVDVPNATLMVVENAERLGLTQLHQLRGRVGRGAAESSCVLMYRPPLSRLGKARMGILRQTSDGFEIARRDLELRGPGEVLGTRQTGMLQFRVADLARDRALIGMIHEAAADLQRAAPHRVSSLIQRWLGASTQYGNV